MRGQTILLLDSANALEEKKNKQENISKNVSIDLDIKKSIIDFSVYPKERRNSIQWNAAQYYLKQGYDIVFDDDSAGEAADLVCIKEEKDKIILTLIHCKFTTSSDPGERVKDVVEVASQAIRSSKWKWKFPDLCKHLRYRESKLGGNRTSRFLKGQPSHLNHFFRLSRVKEIHTEIVIVQPGLSISSVTDDQKMVLASTHAYLKETVDVELKVICSK